MQSPGVGFFFTDWMNLSPGIIPEPGMTAQFRRIVAKEPPGRGSRPHRVFPFRLSGQAVAVCLVIPFHSITRHVIAGTQTLSFGQSVTEFHGIESAHIIGEKQIIVFIFLPC
jgi:hypothetical protein